MKSLRVYFIKHWSDFLVIGLFILFISLSIGQDWTIGKQSLASFWDSLLEMLSFVPGVFLLVGLMDAWVPKEVVAKHTGTNAGWQSSLWMILLAMLQAGPLYGAFPVAYLMWKKGTSVRNIFIYLGAFTTLKLPILGFEIGFLGIKFTLLRTFFSLPVFLLIAYVMDRIYGKDFRMSDGHTPRD